MPTAAQLKAVIENDTDAIGFKNPDDSWKGDQEIADLFNGGAYTVDRAEIEKKDLISSVIYDDYNGLVADEQEWLRWITAGDGMVKVSADIKQKLTNTANGGGIWLNADTTSPAAILALIEFQGSYAESLWGEGEIISAGDVGRAANA